MRCCIVTGSQFQRDLLDRLLTVAELSEFTVVRGGRRTAAVALAGSILAARSVPVVVLLDADTVEPEGVREQEEMHRYLLRRAGYAPGLASAVLMAVPQVEAVLFGDLEALECVLGRRLTGREAVEGEFRPRALLQRLIEEAGMDEDAFLERIGPRAAGRFAAHPLIRSLVQFVESAGSAVTASAA